MWFYIRLKKKEKKREKKKCKKRVNKDRYRVYLVLGREWLREFEVCNLEGYNKFDLPFT